MMALDHDGLLIGQGDAKTGAEGGLLDARFRASTWGGEPLTANRVQKLTDVIVRLSRLARWCRLRRRLFQKLGSVVGSLGLDLLLHTQRGA
jgi:hypothetical protein